jgi:hypothetical protein
VVVRNGLDAPAHARFDQLVAVYQTLQTSSGNIQAAKLAEEMIGKEPSQRSISDLNTLEIAVLASQPIDTVRRRAWTLRSEFRDIAGAKMYDAYLASLPPDPAATGNEQQLRADLEQLLDVTLHLRAIIPKREAIRSQISLRVSAGTMAILFIGLLVLYGSTRQGAGPLTPALPIALAIVSGAVGGFVSMQRRLQSITAEGTSFTQLEQGSQGILLSPISGSVFAVLVYVLFISGLMTGPLFPSFLPATSTAVFGLPSLHSLYPEHVSDFGKLLIWSFLAGFAERLVPDILDRLVDKAQSTQSTPIPATGFASGLPGPGGRAIQPAVVVSPASISVTPRGSVQFTARVLGSSGNAPVQWSVQPNGAGGTIDATTGIYTAPDVAGTDTVTAKHPEAIEPGHAPVTITVR